MSGAPPMLGEPWFSELRDFDNRRVETPETNAGDHRYAYYRRRGHPPESSLAYALAWERNMSEQRERRKSHGTGAE